MNVHTCDVGEDIKQTERDDVAVKNLPKESEGEDEEGQDEVMHPMESFISSQVNPEMESLQEEITKGEDTKQPIHNDEGMGNMQREGKGDGAGGPQLDGEGGELEINESPENSEISKSKNEEGAHCISGLTLSQVTPPVKSPPEESIRENPEDLVSLKSKDVTNDENSERRCSLKKEEHKRSAEEHSGEGDSPCHEKKERSVKTQDTKSSKFILIYALFGAVLAVTVLWFMRGEAPPVQKEFNLLDVFRHEMDKVQSSFPNQHKELWRRSKIHLLRHLQMSRPNEPVSLILTSGRGAEKTLGCLAQRLAAAFSTSLNASALDIDGASKTAEDSDQVKLDIDRALREAFDAGKQAAVIHRFEELPPGSTLIFYRYCDHENAAYKNIFLAFTVLLAEELEVLPNVSLGMVEEMVQEYLKEKFVSSHRTTMFNQMDVDKLSGLWSRISHLILPVAAEQKVELHGCGGLG
ncbi:torsin-1A-interacting protein 1 [Pygocentrus nattereri]|uniref:Uncharacterized protein n=1 Tax=Pygocentrus nattereri TaxID=42514 RepID=A0A3B4DAJ2_PYGNA|nr:torsin-1A-interacting protein 1 [Pygocentrus nattereri]